ncbi:LytR/AlgR family response regulator transcription factor [Alkalitalea saponilacus]|uniref:Two component transcriptional regulator, LytTR family n=1 Tax=Alkalitalea saponilacus TaxID=889453 RepID=A0A1T5CCQ5_9BACT|nr:LytTR family DNA-binding domain-containing protein [Alkalitalea saponilacus]ASB49809.1 DNA-binding response regulator [Alkalitalea saponilacus]SKB57111.1 two component transcriptional regulator, LytTR family [Alkalitalea saponilacus]
MLLKCVAIDDDPLCLSILKKYCQKVPSLRLRGAYENPTDALPHLDRINPDIVFLDINMPEISGIRIAEIYNHKTTIIFTTSHKDFALEGFELNAADYLLKPLNFERFFQAVCKAKDRIEFKALKKLSFEDNDHVIIKSDYKNIKLKFSQILFIEALDNYVKIHTAKRNYLTLQNLKHFSKRLNGDFVRVHKSYIVAVSKIEYFSRDQLRINGREIPIGRSYAQNFHEKVK